MRDPYECQILINVVTIWLTVCMCKGHGQWTLADPWLYVCVWLKWIISYEIKDIQANTIEMYALK